MPARCAAAAAAAAAADPDGDAVVVGQSGQGLSQQLQHALGRGQSLLLQQSHMLQGGEATMLLLLLPTRPMPLLLLRCVTVAIPFL